jgi:hypothetical protein
MHRLRGRLLLELPPPGHTRPEMPPWPVKKTVALEINLELWCILYIIFMCMYIYTYNIYICKSGAFLFGIRTESTEVYLHGDNDLFASGRFSSKHCLFRWREERDLIEEKYIENHRSISNLDQFGTYMVSFDPCQTAEALRRTTLHARLEPGPWDGRWPPATWQWQASCVFLKGL